jgi:maintenance of mitochondrial morphology protein 1
MSNYVLSLQPTFTQGLILGQLSVLILLGTILRYLFLDSSKNPFETTSYHPQFDRKAPSRKQDEDARSHSSSDEAESLDWFNALLQQVTGIPSLTRHSTKCWPDC